jgi:hypothetical protein
VRRSSAFADFDRARVWQLGARLAVAQLETCRDELDSDDYAALLDVLDRALQRERRRLRRKDGLA